MFGMQIREGATFIRNFLCWHCLCVCVPNEVFRYRYRRYFTIIEYYRNGDVDPSLRTKRSQTVHCIIAIIISLTQCHALSDCEPSVENMMYTYVTTHTTFTGFRFIFEFSTKSRSRCSSSILVMGRYRMFKSVSVSVFGIFPVFFQVSSVFGYRTLISRYWYRFLFFAAKVALTMLLIHIPISVLFTLTISSSLSIVTIHVNVSVHLPAPI